MLRAFLVLSGIRQRFAFQPLNHGEEEMWDVRQPAGGRSTLLKGVVNKLLRYLRAYGIIGPNQIPLQ